MKSSATICAFPQRKKGPQPWTNEELAELYRVVDILARAGLPVETDMGMSDEGDPWFVFCRADTGDVIAHFARIGGQFVAASVSLDQTYRGADFRQIVDQMVRSQPLMLPPPSRGTRLLLHPVVILTAFVATALAHSEKALAADHLRPVDPNWDHHSAHGGHQDSGHAAPPSWFESLQASVHSPSVDGHADAGPAAGSGGAHGISLSSLIAIAMTAMQPVVEKLSFISEAMAAEPHGASTGHHAPVVLANDLPTIDQLAVKVDDAIMVRPEAYLHQHQPASADHQQAAATTAEGIGLQHADGAAVAPSTIGLDEVSNQALQILNIHVNPTAASSDLTLAKGQVAAVIDAIAHFADSGSYDFQQPVHATSDLQTVLADYTDGHQPLKVIVFGSDTVTADVFPFSPGVVFVDERHFAPSAPLHSPAGHVVIDLPAGGSVTLVGVTTIDHTTV